MIIELQKSSSDFGNHTGRAGRGSIVKLLSAITEDLGNTTFACKALGLPRSSYYRHLKPPLKGANKEKRRHPRSLNSEAKERVQAVLHEDRFADKAPQEVYASLLDEGIYLCSISTMYRILRERNEGARSDVMP